MDPDDRRDAAAETRRQRAAIAAQACELCRSRKSKCDEERPKCGLCRRMNVDCNYRDPRPTKKDKTLDNILQALHRTEDKLEQLLEVTCGRSASPAPTQDGKARASPPQTRPHVGQKGSPRRADRPSQRDAHLAALHRVVLWPAVSTLLHDHEVEAALDLPDIAHAGSAWFMQQELDKHPHILSPHVGLQSVPLHAPRADGMPRVTFPTLTRHLMKQYADRYFNTYNLLYPVLDYADFMQQTLPKVIEEGFGYGCFKSLIALLVFALGKVALDGEFGKPIAIKDDKIGGIRGHLSGVRGGTTEESPGLEIFNEARRRLGFVVSHICLENVQVLLLKATYYETCSRHADFWRTTLMASEAVKVILKRRIDWTSHEGDMIKRAYWICNIIEGWCHADLDLPESGVSDYQDEVPLPLFVQQAESSMDLDSGTSGDMLVSYQYNFLGMIAIRRLIDRIGCEIYDVSDQDGSREGSANAPTHIIKELDRQLLSWRTLLPQPLQWTDEQRGQYMWYDPHTKNPNLMEFVVDRDGDQLSHMYNIDVIIAQLRSRFYYCRFMIYRPFLYKALHFPERMTDEDIEGCVIGLESCLVWPVCMWPVKNKKRLLPNIFVWTQSFLSILILFRMAAEDTLLKQILETRLPGQKVRDSIEMMLDWMRDMRRVSGIAAWSWKVLEPLYQEVW